MVPLLKDSNQKINVTETKFADGNFIDISS